MKASIRELRSKTKQILRAVERGETVVISNRGRSCAKIVSLKQAQPKAAEPEAAYGMWKQHSKTQDVKAYIRQIRQGRHAR